jgi:superfamily II DNA or RNA helicase
MSRIFDNIEQNLLAALRATMKVSTRADFCVGYLNLRGWQAIDDLVQPWQPSAGQICRVLVGMQRPPQEDIRALYRTEGSTPRMDNGEAARLKTQFAAHLREQIVLGIPSGRDEAGLRTLAAQLRAGQVVVKLFLPYPLHAKLYLLFREDANNPITGFVGSSNLTLSGLSGQGELNVDVLDHLGSQKLATWFEARWAERWALDVSADLALLIETSWARPTLTPPQHIYLNMAYHLSSEARAGLSQFRLPARFEQSLFEFQKSAVKIAARHLHRRGGVMIGDVVGLGKTMMATALARMFEDDWGHETLILCPKNLVPMWEHHRREYGLRGQVLPVSQVTQKLPGLRRYRLVLIDESHNLRNREGRRYKAIADYIRSADARVILLTATPYNKNKTDLSAQLRLFIDEQSNIGIRPEHHLRKLGLSDAAFERKHQCGVNTIAAMEKSDEFDDWRELIRLYMVRRTRSFITQHYAQTDAQGRHFLLGQDGQRRYFPQRRPVSAPFSVSDADPADRYAQLYSSAVVDDINALHVPRYGLGLYVEPQAQKAATAAERKLIDNLGRAGKRLMGFCRTNLFKRLESSGQAFLLSLDRHILRNELYLYALENGLALPVGVLDAGLLDAERVDEDAEGLEGEPEDLLDGLVSSVAGAEDSQEREPAQAALPASDLSRARQLYARYTQEFKKRYKWLRAELFKPTLAADLAQDTQALRRILHRQGQWLPEQDQKLQTLLRLVRQTHAKDKLLVFTQFADTARYLYRELRRAGVTHIDLACGTSADPHALACRFSPRSNNHKLSKADELRVLICTDVLSEGQNLQDASVVVNFDLPWAIIRLIQRAGRVDRIGQQAQEIFCYSFLPAEGVERLIQLRRRIRERLLENAEVVGTDEAFFEDEEAGTIRDLYTERQGVLDDADEEVDLASYAWQIWKQATEHDPALAQAVANLPPVVYSAKTLPAEVAYLPQLGPAARQGGVLVYVKSPDGNDHLAWVGTDGQPVTESQFTVLRAAQCAPGTPAVARALDHHAQVAQALQLATQQEKTLGGGLGRPNSPRRRVYERLKPYAAALMNSLFRDEALERALDALYQRPLLETAAEVLGHLMRNGVNDDELAQALQSLHDDGRLCYADQEAEQREPRVVCSLGLVPS